ncbi:MAG: TetR/AcrR family transcriptional regulator [Actinobacteria bacterium]|nr:TetR/AcrR family transcriptional regulator [Actinomycetota bacterium]
MPTEVVAPSPPDPGTKARRTYDALLDAMERLLEGGGYPAATSTAVAAEAGLSVGTFYAYFSDRDEALAALFARRLDALIDAVDAALTTDALLDDGLEPVLERVLDVVLDGYGRHASAFRAALVQLPSSPPIAAVYWDRHSHSAELIATFLRRAQAAGAVRDGDADVLAQALLVIMQGTNTPVLLAQPRSRGTRAIRAELHRALAATLRP